jgi:flagellar protein FlbT
MRISLRAGERFYINGAVIRAGHKTTIELLNDASFLLEGHVLQPEDATTPLRQLYFALQTLFIDPTSGSARDAYLRMYAAAGRTFTTADVLVGLRNAAKLTEEGRTFEALRTIRNLFPLEESILGGVNANAA